MPWRKSRNLPVPDYSSDKGLRQPPISMQSHDDIPLRMRSSISARALDEDTASLADIKNATTQVQQLHHTARPAPWLERVWLWEVSACILGIMSLGAIVGVLVYEDGRPLDNWHLIIAPTAVVSFLGTLAKSSMLLALSEVLS